ncbi:hypothetical protein ACOMHN_066344 [Nucella lapillus]
MSMMRARVRGHRWVDHPAAAVMKARVPGQWVDCPAAVVMEAREQGRCWIDHPAVAGAAAPRSVQLFQYRGEVGGGVGEVLALIDTVLSASTPSPSPTVASPPPLLLQCSDGVTKSGLFSALCDVITRVTYDRQVDVFMTVRHLQTVMPAAVMSLEQYHYCYEVVQARVRESSIYANT